MQEIECLELNKIERLIALINCAAWPSIMANLQVDY